MTTYLALDKDTNDLFKPIGGGVSRVSEGRFVVQLVRNKLDTALGEWLLDTTVGWVNQEDFEKNFDQFDIEDRARKIILGTLGVLAIDSLEAVFAQRKLSITFEARTIYGVISQTIPWGAL